MSAEYSRAEGEELDILLHMNQQLREEVRAHGKRKSRRYLGSLTVLGVLIGYLFTTNGDARVLVLVPFVLGFLYFSHLSSMNYVIQLAALLALIEARINAPGAEYEFYHGGFSIGANPRFAESKMGAESNAEPVSSSPQTLLSPLRQMAQQWGLGRINGNPNDPYILQRTVQSRVRDGMYVLAVLSYCGAAVIGAAVLSRNGLPELGFTGGYAVAMSLGILIVQGGLLVQLIIAWSGYRQHRALLTAGVRDVLDRDDFDVGLRTRGPFVDSN